LSSFAFFSNCRKQPRVVRLVVILGFIPQLPTTTMRWDPSSLLSLVLFF
jgi:hypothetical protein